VTSSLPQSVQRVFESFVTTEYTTIDAHGQPITWPVTPYYKPGDICIDVTTGLGYPKKAADAERNPQVGLLFSDQTGSGIERAPMVLVQGTADVDDRDLDANAARYWRESGEKLPATKKRHPPAFIRRGLAWYYTRLYVHVRPERVFVWPEGDPSQSPELLDSHIEEVRSGHDEEPEDRGTPPQGGPAVWDARLDALGTRTYPTAVLSIVAPDGFPFSIRLPVRPDESAQCIRFEADALGVPVAPGRACLTAHIHEPTFTWQSNFQVRGDFVERDGEWIFVPHKFVGGFNVPKSQVGMMRENFKKSLRFRRIAKQQLAKRTKPKDGARHRL
jgi:hypothetical protein